MDDALATFVKKYHAAHPGRAQLMLLLRLDDSTDPWGTGMNWWFGIADVLYHADPIVIPPSWDYRHGAGCMGPEDWPESEIAALLECGDISVDDLLYAGQVVTRYLAAVKVAGQDY